MKKLGVLLACLTLYGVVQLISSCADPLDNGQSGAISPSRPPTIDTLKLVDTLYIVDTTFITDSVFVIDTTFVIDTVVHADTVYIVVPDTVLLHHCSRLGAGEHEIVWLLQNQEGNYHLDFAALAERFQPKQTAVVDINGETYEWSPARQSELVIDQFLKANSIIRIDLSEPCAYGHSIDICLLMTPVN